jgi:hypothetical protein
MGRLGLEIGDLKFQIKFEIKEMPLTVSNCADG